MRLRVRLWHFRINSVVASTGARAMPRVVLGGKFKGSTYSDALSDRRYSLWVLEATSLPPGLHAFKRWLVSRYGGIMAVGKYKLKTFREIVDEDPAYCVWVCDLETPTEAMQRFQVFSFQKNNEHRF